MRLRSLSLAAFASLVAACSLISGASDLEITDGLEGGPAPGEDGSTPTDGGPRPDGTAPPVDGGADGPRPDGGPVDAGPDAGEICKDDAALVLRVRFDEAGGMVVDDCVAGIRGTFGGDAQLVPGRRGNAISMSAGWVDFGAPAALRLTGALTVAAWVRPTTLPSVGGAVDYIFGRRPAAPGAGYRIALDADGVSFLVSSAPVAAQTVTAKGGGVPVLNQWLHVAGVFTPSQTVRVYVGGALADQAAATNVATAGSQDITSRVGARGDANNTTFLRGAVDDLRLYSRALSTQEIAALAGM